MRQRPRCPGSESMAGSQRQAYGVRASHGSSSNSGRRRSSSSRRWVEMAPDILANIFARLPFEQLLKVIPCVCKSWNIASLDPLCWQVLDLPTFRVTPRLLGVLLQRSQGCLLEFICPGMNLDCLKILAHSAPLVQKLHIPWGGASDEWAVDAAPLMPCITDLDLSEMKNSLLSHVALEAFGKHCKLITHLRKNEFYNALNNLAEDDREAFTIAQHFPSLKRLELRHNCLSTQGVRAILDGCPMLEHLDLTACVMDMDEALLNRCLTRLRVFVRPRPRRHGEDDDGDEDDEEGDGIESDYEECCIECGFECGFPEMRADCPGDLDHFCGACDCFRCCHEHEEDVSADDNEDGDDDDGSYDEDGNDVDEDDSDDVDGDDNEVDDDDIDVDDNDVDGDDNDVEDYDIEGIDNDVDDDDNDMEGVDNDVEGVGNDVEGIDIDVDDDS